MRRYCGSSPRGLIVCAGRIHGKTCQRLSSSNPVPGSILLHMRHAQSTVDLNLWTSCIIVGPGMPAG